MVKLPFEDVGGIYAAFMEEIKTRLKAIERALRKIHDLRGRGDGFLYAESCFLQIRMICELIALAVLTAHNEVPEANTSKMLSRWNADEIFDRLMKLNPHCYPSPIREAAKRGAEALHFEDREGDYLKREELKSVYHTCGDYLHKGALKHVYDRKVKTYNPDHINRWAAAIHRLLETHAVLLPDLNTVLLVNMAGPDGKVQCFLARGLEGDQFSVAP